MNGQRRGIVFIDTETGGLDPATDALLSVGAAHWVDGEIVAATEWLVKPEGRTVHATALAVNKIDLDRHERFALSRQAAGLAIAEWMNARRDGDTKRRLRVGGHNVAFDVAFLKPLMPPDAWRGLFLSNTVDTAGLLTFMRQAGRLPPGADMSLANGMKAVGIKQEQAHTAMGDARATAQLYGRLLTMVRFDHAP